jgi:hypothetical protein
MPSHLAAIGSHANLLSQLAVERYFFHSQIFMLIEELENYDFSYKPMEVMMLIFTF